ncbi:MAG: Cysteine desulfurase IscS [Chlamydiales bacterium]|nr:Cysteine desulfurase IscS [Chlamydiales bacterium]MCH9620344.1 Cysteine desulfurase IscS [Chlamydiales bacterium]MCH9622330.1 Cysteine desulfurase IscS [Chlamydiales bacterium]
MIYLDNNSTTKPDKNALEAMAPLFEDLFGNPSSLHAFGQKASDKISEVRRQIAHQIGADETEIYFVSSGTEANNYCLIGMAYAYQKKGRHLITSKIEHASVLKTCAHLEKQGFEVTYLDVDDEGFVLPETLQEAIRPETTLISIGHVNSEIGTIQPLQQLIDVAEEIPFHTDAVQSFLKTDFHLENYPVALASFSGHKFHAPKGVGFFYRSKKLQLAPLIHGGAQEMNLRAGTENSAFIIAMGEAMRLYDTSHVSKMKELQAYLFSQLVDRFQVKINGPKNLDHRICTNVNVSFDNIEGELLLGKLSDQQIYISTGSACSSKASRISHVLEATSCPPSYIHGNIRIGLSRETTLEEIKQCVESIEAILSSQRFFTLN